MICKCPECGEIWQAISDTDYHCYACGHVWSVEREDPTDAD